MFLPSIDFPKSFYTALFLYCYYILLRCNCPRNCIFRRFLTQIRVGCDKHTHALRYECLIYSARWRPGDDGSMGDDNNSNSSEFFESDEDKILWEIFTSRDCDSPEMPFQKKFSSKYFPAASTPKRKASVIHNDRKKIQTKVTNFYKSSKDIEPTTRRGCKSTRSTCSPCISKSKKKPFSMKSPQPRRKRSRRKSLTLSPMEIIEYKKERSCTNTRTQKSVSNLSLNSVTLQTSRPNACNFHELPRVKEAPTKSSNIIITSKRNTSVDTTQPFTHFPSLPPETPTQRKSTNPWKSYTEPNLKRKFSSSPVEKCSKSFESVPKKRRKKINFDTVSTVNSQKDLSLFFPNDAKVCSTQVNDIDIAPMDRLKQCASCETCCSAIWRQAEEGIYLCNKCDIRWKKHHTRCTQCWMIPLKENVGRIICEKCGDINTMKTSYRMRRFASAIY